MILIIIFVVAEQIHESKFYNEWTQKDITATLILHVKTKAK